MKSVLLLLTPLLISLFGCSDFAKSQLNKNKIIKVAYSSAVPIFRFDINEQIDNSDTVNFYFKDSFVVIQKYVLQSNFKENDIGNGDTAYLIFKGETYTNTFFLYKKSSKYGIYTDSTGNGKKLLADSFLQKNITQFTLSENYKNIWKLFSTKKNNNLQHEKYASIEINSMSLKKDTMLLSFNKDYKDLELDISHLLDSTYDSKLFDLRLIISSYYDSIKNIKVPRQEVYMNIEKQEITNTQKAFINKLVEKFKTANLLSITDE